MSQAVAYNWECMFYNLWCVTQLDRLLRKIQAFRLWFVSMVLKNHGCSNWGLKGGSSLSKVSVSCSFVRLKEIWDVCTVFNNVMLRFLAFSLNRKHIKNCTLDLVVSLRSWHNVNPNFPVFPHYFLGSSIPASSSSTVSVSLLSGGCLGLDKFKKPEGSWDCEVCLVENKADSNKCVACESAKPGTKSEFTGKVLAKCLLRLPL